MSLIKKITFTLAILATVCISIINKGYAQRFDLDSRISNHYDRNLSATYNAYATAYSEQNLNNVSQPKILYNYFLSLLFESRLNNSNNSEERLGEISLRLKDISPSSFETNYIQFLNNKGTEIGLSFLKKAYDLEPNEIELWDEMLGYHEIMGNASEARALAKMIKESHKYHADIYQYQRNVIASCEGNSFLFVNGELDTYPLLVVLYTEPTDNDIVVLSQELLSYESYEVKMSEKFGTSLKLGKNNSKKVMDNLSTKHLGYKTYIALTMKKSFLSSLKKNLFLTGTTFQYSTKSIDNITVCENNFDHEINLTHIFNKSIKPLEVRDLHRNYIPFLSLLEKYGTNLGPENISRVKALKSVITNSLPNQ